MTMKQKGFGDYRFLAHKQYVGFGYDPWSDCYILRLGFIQFGKVRHPK